MIIELNKKWILIGIDNSTLDDVINGEHTELFVSECGMFTRDIIYKVHKGGKLYEKSEEAQNHCIQLLGKGKYYELLTIKDKPYTEIPKDWRVYKNYNGGKNFKGLAKASDKMNLIDPTWKDTAVKSFNSALDALGNPDAVIVVLNQKYKELNNGNLEKS